MTRNVDLLESVSDKTADLIENVVGEFRHRPTPSPGRDVGQLVNHMIGWMRMFAAHADGKPFDEAPDDYRSGGNPAAEFSSAAGAAVAAFRDKGTDRAIAMLSTELPAEDVVGMMLIEYVGHGWDLAVATGQPVPYSDEEAGAALDAGHATLLPDYRGDGKPFADEVEVPADATALDRLAGFLGRNPGDAR